MSKSGYTKTDEIADRAITPREFGLDVRNETGGTLTAGTLVCVSGYNATKDRFLVVKADANAARKKATWVVRASFPNNTNARVGKYYRLTGTATANVDTSATTIGDAIYLSATAGGWTKTDPFDSVTDSQQVGVVRTVSATVGVIDFDLTLDNVKLSALNVAISTGAFSLTSDISPAAFAAQQDDYNPTDLATASVLRLTSTGAQSITGIQGGSDGRILAVHNIGAANITLKDADAGSAAANRFALASDVILAPDDGCILQYDSTSSRWRSVASSASMGGAAGDLAGNYPNPTVSKSSTAFALSGVLSPAQITASQDDYNPASLSTASVLRLNLDAAWTITGLQGGSAGRVMLVHNISAFSLTLSDEGGTSTAANRFALQGNVVLAPDTSIVLQYDSTSSRWRMLGGVLPVGALTATAAGRALMATGWFDVATALDKFAADSIANAFLIQAIANGAFAADDTTRALFGAGFLGLTATGRALMADGFVDPAAMSVEVWNDTGLAMAANDLVYISGYNAANSKPTIAKADSDAAGKRAQYVCIGAIADGTAGRVYKTFTSAADQNTAAAGAAGDPVYLSTVAGAYVIAAPAAGVRKQIVGHVKVKDAAVGVVVFNTESTNDELFGTTELAAAAVTNTKMPAGVISADATGRALMAANVFDVATALDKFAVDSLANAFLLQAVANGAFVADDATRALFAANFLGTSATGRALMQAGFFDEATATDKFAAQAITGAIIKNLTITNGLLAAGILSADVVGRALMAASYFDEATATDKFAAQAITGALIKNLTITNGLLAAGILSADVTGRALMATGFFTEAKATDAFAAQAITGALIKDLTITNGLLAAGILSADVTGRALMATGFFTEAKATDAFDAQAITGALIKNLAVDNAQMAAGAALANLAAGSVTEAKVVVPDGNTLNLLRCAKYTYDFAVLGGAISTIALTGTALPAKAIIVDGLMEVLTPLTAVGAAAAAIETEAANDTIVDAVVAGAPWSTSGRKAIVPVSAATAVKTTVARTPSIVITVDALTAGKFNLWVRYYVSD